MNRNQLQQATHEMSRLMGESRFDGKAPAPPIPFVRPTSTPAAAPAAAKPSIAETDIEIGTADIGGPIGIDLAKLMDGRLLIQGASGAGKSWTLRRLLEQTADRVQQVVIDPEGEFRALSERFGHTVVEGHRLDLASLATVAARIREHRVSAIFDLSDLDRDGQMKAVAAIFGALVDAPRDQWLPLLVAVDEAHLFAPFGGQSAAASSVRKAAIDAVTDLMSRGRKRGLCGVLATQRLARIAKSVVSEAQNFLIGLNTLDLDIRRAAETIGWDARRAFDRLPMLEPGDFVAVGPSFSRSPATLRVGGIVTEHKGAAPIVTAPAPLSAGAAAGLLDLDALIEASQAEEDIRAEVPVVPGLRAVRGLLRDTSFPLISQIWTALRPLYPEGVAVADLAVHFDSTDDAISAALAALDMFGALEFTETGAGRTVRVHGGLAP